MQDRWTIYVCDACGKQDRDECGCFARLRAVPVVPEVPRDDAAGKTENPDDFEAFKASPVGQRIAEIAGEGLPSSKSPEDTPPDLMAALEASLQPRGTCVVHGDYWTDDCLRCGW